MNDINHLIYRINNCTEKIEDKIELLKQLKKLIDYEIEELEMWED